MNGAEWLVRTLRDRGVEQVFVLCGNGLNPFLYACHDLKMKLIDVRNEQAAVFAAEAYGRMTRRLGVAAVSSGPGHTNALTGLANAWWDGGPLLLLSGCSEMATRGLGHFQELDQVGMAAPVCKYANLVPRVEMLTNEVRAALAAAVSGRPGPVHLTIPADVWSAEVDEMTAQQRDRRLLEVNPQQPGDAGLVREAVDRLAAAKRPVIVVGSGAFYARAGEALPRFAALTNIPIFSLMWDRGCLDQAIPQYVGVTSAEVNGAFPLVARADVILTLGGRVDYRLGYGRPPVCAPNVRFIRVDVEPGEVIQTVQPEVGIVGDPRSVLEQMIAEAEGKEWGHETWLGQVRRARERFLAKWEKRGWENVCPVPSLRICREIKKFLDQDVTFLLDGGNIGRWAHLLFSDRHPAHWFTCGASGVIGWGLPGGVAANLAWPGRPVLLLSGDGAAGFTVTEIETALRFDTPYVAVIAHDSAWGVVADGQPDDKRVASEFGEIRFDRVAQALGAEGVFIESPDDLAPAIERGLAAKTVTVIHVPTQLCGIGAWEKRYGGKGKEGERLSSA